jgi:formyltetrahydrofolate deformylase
MPAPELVLTLSCPDRRGIVHAVSRMLDEHQGNILDSQQFRDPASSTFFMRVHFALEGEPTQADVGTALTRMAAEWGMRVRLYDLAVLPRMLILVSRLGHCLNDLLYRWRTGWLAAEVVGVASNHDDHSDLAASYGLPYHRLPGSDATEDDRDRALLAVVEEASVEVVVLARYMQVLGPAACAELAERAINIHHSFLPSFRGADPYRQAHERGVKLIGATAHYVSEHLDDGPIIEQEVARVDHAHGPRELARIGRDVECVTLARAVRWHVERRVLVHGARTVVFR